MNDPEVAEQFVSRYKPVIEKYLTRETNARGPFEDVVQEIFVRIIKTLQKYEHQGTGSFRAWLKKVVHSVYCDWVREEIKQRNRIEPLDCADPALSESLPEAFALQYDRELMVEAVRRVRLEIDPRTWQMFELAQIQGLPAAQIAQMFGVAVRTVYGASHRVLQRLREMVAYLDRMGE